jgi:hypothetical protein
MSAYKREYGHYTMNPLYSWSACHQMANREFRFNIGLLVYNTKGMTDHLWKDASILENTFECHWISRDSWYGSKLLCFLVLAITELVIQTGQSGDRDDVQHWIQYTEPKHANTNVNMGITQWIHYTVDQHVTRWRIGNFVSISVYWIHCEYPCSRFCLHVFNLCLIPNVVWLSSLHYSFSFR